MTQFIIGASDKFYLKNDRQNMENKLITDIEKLRKEISDLKKEINRLKEQKFYFI
jgi:cell division septum initiation protein DivIVA